MIRATFVAILRHVTTDYAGVSMHFRLLAAVCWLSPALLGAQGAGPSADARTADSLLTAGNYERAFSAFDALVHRDSTVARYWYQLGMAAANLHRYERGAEAFAKATMLVPNMIATYNTAAMHARLGHSDEAFSWLTTAVRQGFSDEKTLKTDDDLASIRADKRFEKILYDATHAATPCAADPERRKFDFWAGDWTVTTAGGTVVGSSSVQVINGGCSLLENWTAARGSTGKSLNSFNPATGKWQQYWVDQTGGVTEYRESEWHGGAVSFFARAQPANGSPLLQRLTFSALSDSVVRQHGERSIDDGKTWTTTYDFYYHRRR
jgi:tetratricopeptide (TPR) repeat protein